MTVPDLFAMVHLKHLLEDNLGGPVDIVQYREKMNPYLKEHIQKRPSMFDRGLAREITRQMLEAIRRIERRAAGVSNPDDFVSSDDGLDKLDAICMMLIAIGESCKQLDKHTEGQLLPKYPGIDWKGIKGIRDVMSHQYFDINAEIVFSVCRNHTHNSRKPLSIYIEIWNEVLYNPSKKTGHHFQRIRKSDII
jgi:uncharacterized protein with HEPN domain